MCCTTSPPPKFWGSTCSVCNGVGVNCVNNIYKNFPSSNVWLNHSTTATCFTVSPAYINNNNKYILQSQSNDRFVRETQVTVRSLYLLISITITLNYIIYHSFLYKVSRSALCSHLQTNNFQAWTQLSFLRKDWLMFAR